jgi:hypothetical protein
VESASSKLKGHQNVLLLAPPRIPQFHVEEISLLDPVSPCPARDDYYLMEGVLTHSTNLLSSLMLKKAEEKHKLEGVSLTPRAS